MSKIAIEEPTVIPAGHITDATLERWMVWSGLFMVGVVVVGMVIAGFLPPPSAETSAEKISARFIEDKTSILIGCSVMFFGISFWATWAVSISLSMRRMERGLPILTYASLVFSAVGTMIFLLSPFLWLVAAFRPEGTPADITRSINDAAWLMFIWPSPPYTVWAVLVGVAILNDKNEPRILPRWAAYLNLFFAVDVVATITTAFFKTGPLSWTGIISFWNICVVTCIWIAGMTVAMLRAIKEQENRLVRVTESERVVSSYGR